MSGRDFYSNRIPSARNAGRLILYADRTTSHYLALRNDDLQAIRLRDIH